MALGLGFGPWGWGFGLGLGGLARTLPLWWSNLGYGRDWASVDDQPYWAGQSQIIGQKTEPEYDGRLCQSNVARNKRRISTILKIM